MHHSSALRLPLFAGRYYPPAAAQLQAMVAAYVEDALVVAPPQPIVGLIVPHATLYEAGPIAGFAFKALMLAPQRWDCAVLLAATRADTPLCCDPREGYVLTDGQVMPVIDPQDVLGEHVSRSPDGDPQIEITLPFLNYALGAVPILPLRVGTDATPHFVALRLPSCAVIVVIANLVDDVLLRAAHNLDADLLTRAPQPVWQRWRRRREAPSCAPDTSALRIGLKLLREAGGKHCQVLHRRGAFAAAVVTG